VLQDKKVVVRVFVLKVVILIKKSLEFGGRQKIPPAPPFKLEKKFNDQCLLQAAGILVHCGKETILGNKETIFGNKETKGDWSISS